MKKTLTLFLLLAALSGCGNGMISVDAISPAVRSVSARHDAYIRADESLSQSDRDTFLRTSELLLKVLDTAEKGTP